MDDDLDLLRDPDGGGGDGDGGRGASGRPWGLLAAALAAVLVAVAGLVWVVGSLTGGDTDVVPAAASPTATTAAPTTTPPAEAPTTTTAPTTTAPSPTATTRAPAPPLPTLSPTPRVTTPAPPATTTRRPTLPPLPPRPGVRVPDVTGLRVPAATITLRAAGFRVAVPGGVVAPRPDQRRVRSQTPTGGTLAPKGSTVTLVLDSS